MAPKQRVTHNDVARRAGVSTAVVSYVINNGPRATSDEVRARVLQAIEELGYHPNAFARGLRAGHTHTIGFIINDYYAASIVAAWYTAAVLTGLMAHLKAQGYYMLVYPLLIGESLTNIEVLLHSGRLDGLVLRLVQGAPATDTLLELIASTHIPCVCIEQPAAARFGFSAVTHDDRQGAYAATNYLIAQGHRRIGHVSGDPRYGLAHARREGYQAALADAGLPIDEALIFGASWDRFTVAATLAHFFALAAPPTALFAASDELAVAAIQELRQRQYRVPEDIAVVGFDDSELATRVWPTLTTVHIPLHAVGQRAGEIILDLVQSEQGTPARIDVLPVELVHRASA